MVSRSLKREPNGDSRNFRGHEKGYSLHEQHRTQFALRSDLARRISQPDEDFKIRLKVMEL